MPAATRSMRNFATELDRLRVIGGRKVGIVADEFLDPGGHVGDALEHFIEDQGHVVAHRSRLAADVGTFSSQVPVEVQQMQSKGVGLVLLLSNQLASQRFAQQADAQGYRPKYAVTDFASMASDSGNANMPASYNGTLAIRSLRFNEDLVGLPEPPGVADCRRIAQDHTGRSVERTDDAYYVMTQECAVTRIFELATRAAGPNLTRVAFSAGAQALGPLPEVDTYVGGGTFGPQKFGYSDYLRPMRWEFACKCWKPEGAFARASF